MVERGVVIIFVVFVVWGGGETSEVGGTSVGLVVGGTSVGLVVGGTSVGFEVGGTTVGFVMTLV